MSTRRLHRDTSGLASIEIILGMPVFLLMLLALKHSCGFSLTQIQNLVSDRTSAWHYARNAEKEGRCPVIFQLDDLTSLPIKFLSGELPECSALVPEELTEKDRFWNELDQRAGWGRYGDLFAQVRSAPAHEWNKADLDVSYTVPETRLRSLTEWTESEAVPKARFLTIDDKGLDHGYNEPIRSALGWTGDLFPGLFGAQ